MSVHTRTKNVRRRSFTFFVVGVLLLSVFNLSMSAPRSAYAVDGYPDSGATTINASLYEWGYPCGSSCIPGWWGYVNGVKFGYLSPRGYAYRNCTDYVAWKLESQGILPTLVRGRGNGGQWDNSQTGVTVTSTPEVGDAAVIHQVYTGDPYGHVAYVEEVSMVSGAYQVKVSQYNGGLDGTYGLTDWRAASTYSIFVDFNGVGRPLTVGGNASAVTVSSLFDVNGVVHVITGISSGDVFDTAWGNGVAPSTWQVGFSLGSAVVSLSSQYVGGVIHVYAATAAGSIDDIYWGGGVALAQRAVYNNGVNGDVISSQVTSGGVQHVFTATPSGNIYDTSWTGTGAPSTWQVK